MTLVDSPAPASTPPFTERGVPAPPVSHDRTSTNALERLALRASGALGTGTGWYEADYLEALRAEWPE